MRANVDILWVGRGELNKVCLGETAVSWADGHACPTIDTNLWVNIEIEDVGEICFVFARMDAVHRTDLKVITRFSVDTRLSDDKGYAFLYPTEPFISN